MLWKYRRLFFYWVVLVFFFLRKTHALNSKIPLSEVRGICKIIRSNLFYGFSKEPENNALYDRRKGTIKREIEKYLVFLKCMSAPLWSKSIFVFYFRKDYLGWTQHTFMFIPFMYKASKDYYVNISYTAGGQCSQRADVDTVFTFKH